jgi:hypothetical protein
MQASRRAAAGAQRAGTDSAMRRRRGRRIRSAPPRIRGEQQKRKFDDSAGGMPEDAVLKAEGKRRHAQLYHVRIRRYICSSLSYSSTGMQVRVGGKRFCWLSHPTGMILGIRKGPREREQQQGSRSSKQQPGPTIWAMGGGHAETNLFTQPASLFFHLPLGMRSSNPTR